MSFRMSEEQKEAQEEKSCDILELIRIILISLEM